jgi:hypothetical protein
MFMYIQTDTAAPQRRGEALLGNNAFGAAVSTCALPVTLQLVAKPVLMQECVAHCSSQRN